VQTPFANHEWSDRVGVNHAGDRALGSVVRRIRHYDPGDPEVSFLNWADLLHKKTGEIGKTWPAMKTRKLATIAR
jgi:hypothetical protein